MNVYDEKFQLLPNRIQLRINREGPLCPCGCSPCWDWIGAIRHDYGSTTWKGKDSRLAHRVVRHIIVGDIEVGSTPDTILDHGRHCSRRICVNPMHTVPGTYKDNARTSKHTTNQASITNLCIRKLHSLNDPNNIIETPNGKTCKTCYEVRSENYRQTHAEEYKERNIKYNIKLRERKEILKLVESSDINGLMGLGYTEEIARAAVKRYREVKGII